MDEPVQTPGAATPAPRGGPSSLVFKLRKRPLTEKLVDRSFVRLTVILASVVSVTVFGIFFTVGFQAFFQGDVSSLLPWTDDSIWEGISSWDDQETFGVRWGAMPHFGLRFLTTSSWNPVTETYGALTPIYGTLMTSALALLMAVPLGVGTAVMLTEDFLPKRLRDTVGFMVELLAAIPSVVLGLWGMSMLNTFLAVMSPLHNHFGWIPFFGSEPGGPNLAIASLILVVMLLPIITAVSRDSLNQVPLELRQGAYAVGATRWGTIFQVLIPAAISGIVGGTMLALGRALGETMAVTMIIGNSPKLSASWFEPSSTIASLLANQFGEADDIQVSALYYAAFLLMILTFVVNVLAQWIVKKLALKYD